MLNPPSNSNNYSTSNTAGVDVIPHKDPSNPLPALDGFDWFQLLSSPISAFAELNSRLYIYGDPRTRDRLPLTGMQWPILTITLYLTFIAVGPKLMRRRSPMQLVGPMLVYNVLMVGISAFMTYEFAVNAWLCGYRLFCTPYVVSFEPRELRVVFAMYCYYLCKYGELLDTVFMILRKKERQVTILHIFHHGAMIILIHWLTLFAPSNQPVFGCTVNSFIHVVMYTYYALSPFPAFRRYLWWKRYLTQLQLLQFFTMITTTGTGILIDCPYPKWLAGLQVWFVGTLVFLFGNFYVRNYVYTTWHNHQQRRKSEQDRVSNSGTRALQNGNGQTGDGVATSRKGILLKSREQHDEGVADLHKRTRNVTIGTLR